MSAPSPGGEMVLTYRRAVYPRRLDHMGHMNIQFYIATFDAAVWHLFDRIGVTRTTSARTIAAWRRWR